MRFIDSISPYAVKYMKSDGILASLTLAQAILESDSGKSELAMKANNLFGIKANSSWNGEVNKKKTKEYVNGKWIEITASFCKFESLEECIEYRSKVFLKRLHYKPLWGVSNYKDACRIIWECGYATDPNYPRKLIEVIEEYKLYEYDKEVQLMRIMLDAGHGLFTPGKQTPDGMKEFEFNSAVANYAKELLLKYENVTVDFAHDPSGNIDIALIARTNTANSKKADVYVSIHGNAYGSNWNDANGIETFVHPNSSQVSKKLAEIVQKKLIAETGLANRGVKTANYHVLRETNMPAILFECGFMTNKNEAALLKSDEYRKKCAKAIVDSIAEYYNLKLKKEDDELNFSSPSLKEVTEFSLGSRAHRKIIVEAAVKAGASETWLEKLENNTITDADLLGLATMYTVNTNK